SLRGSDERRPRSGRRPASDQGDRLGGWLERARLYPGEAYTRRGTVRGTTPCGRLSGGADKEEPDVLGASRGPGGPQRRHGTRAVFDDAGTGRGASGQAAEGLAQQRHQPQRGGTGQIVRSEVANRTLL